MAYVMTSVDAYNVTEPNALCDAAYNGSRDCSNVTYNVSDSYWLYDGCKAFEFFLGTVVVGLFCLVGILFNTITILVLHRDRQNKVATFLLQTLAFADTGVLIVSFCILSALVGPSQIPGFHDNLRYIAYMYTGTIYK